VLIGLALVIPLARWALASEASHEIQEAAPAAHHGHGGHHEPPKFQTTRPLRTDTQLTRDYVCQIHAIRRIEIRALERGYLEDTFVDEGQTVRRGQHMFQIMASIYQAELDRAAAETAAAQIEYENTKLLAAKEVVSENELALAKARLDQARAEQALKTLHRDLATIKAPFDGILGLLEVRRGSLLDEGELLTTLSDNSEMWVYFMVTEGEYLDYKATHAGAEPEEVELILANGTTFPHKGTVTAIEADFNNETGTIAFRATFPNPEGVLRHGGTGKVRIVTPLHGVLMIPQSATFEILDQRFVFVVDEEGVVHQRRIQVAEELPHLFVVAEGLADDERILLEGLRRVQDGETIRPVDREPTDVIAELDLPAH